LNNLIKTLNIRILFQRKLYQLWRWCYRKSQIREQ